MGGHKRMGDDLIQNSIEVLTDLGIKGNLDIFADKDIISLGGTIVYSPRALQQKQEEQKKHWNKFSEKFQYYSFDQIYRPAQVSDGQWLLMQKAIDVARKWVKNPKGTLSIVSKEDYKYPGIGKTTLARCIATELEHSSVPVIFWRVPNISQAWFSDGKNLPTSLREAFATIDDDFKSSIVKVGQTCPILILDDFGLQYQSDFVDYFITLVVTDRGEKGNPTVVTSPLSRASIQKQYPFLSSRFQEDQIQMGTTPHFDYRAVK
jgi:hypothetical protein